MKCIKTIKVNDIYVNCGVCRACRINYTSQWTLRCLYELSNWNEASFITLTYSDEFLPKDYSLVPRDLTLFWKDLRENLYKEYGFRKKIKYYACGEYGDRQLVYLSPGAKKCHGRPHYHAIVFGLDSFSDRDREVLRNTWKKCEPWLFDKDRGENSAMLPVCREDIAYVTGYVQKKLNGDLADENYGSAIRPFSRVSTYMGFDFMKKNSERLINNGFTYLNGRRIGLPRYFRDKLGISQAELLSKSSVKTKEDYDKENQMI